jgi:hypothetical protein
LPDCLATALAALLAGSGAPALAAAPAEQADAQAEQVAAPTVTGRSVELDAFVWTTTPVALEAGMVLGGGADARLPFGDHGLFLGARLAGGSTTEYTSEWKLNHLHGLASLDAGLERRLGAGSVRAQLGLGALLLVQRAERHQYDRLEAAGLSELRRDGWSLGPWIGAEVGAAVAFYDSWRLFVQLGPGVTVQQVGGARVVRWVVSSGLGVGRAF